MFIVPKFIIDLLMIMVLLVLKLFVSSHPLNFEGVICIYVLLLHEGQDEYPFVMFLYARNKLEPFKCTIIHDLLLVYLLCCNMVAKLYC